MYGMVNVKLMTLLLISGTSNQWASRYMYFLKMKNTWSLLPLPKFALENSTTPDVFVVQVLLIVITLPEVVLYELSSTVIPGQTNPTRFLTVTLSVFGVSGVPPAKTREEKMRLTRMVAIIVTDFMVCSLGYEDILGLCSYDMLYTSAGCKPLFDHEDVVNDFLLTKQWK